MSLEKITTVLEALQPRIREYLSTQETGPIDIIPSKSQLVIMPDGDTLAAVVGLQDTISRNIIHILIPYEERDGTIEDQNVVYQIPPESYARLDHIFG